MPLVCRVTSGLAARVLCHHMEPRVWGLVGGLAVYNRTLVTDCSVTGHSKQWRGPCQFIMLVILWSELGCGPGGWAGGVGLCRASPDTIFRSMA